ncbi:MAG: EpsG family protein [Clostridia bacterium]|nr:EpsG family protein [Clostridia bacterium]
MILILGLRTANTGSPDTYTYSLMFNGIRKYSDLIEYLSHLEILDKFFLFSEGGFYIFSWGVAQIFPSAQWFILITTTIIVLSTARFISKHSEDTTISWLTFICLGSMTFAMNGMRQALAMSICLFAYDFAKEKKLFKFLLIVLLAMLFHKSAIIFALVYILCNMKFTTKSTVLLVAGVGTFFYFADRFALLYDNVTGEDYAAGESFESGGLITVAIYLIAIVGLVIFSQRLKEPGACPTFVLIVAGCALYLARFFSTQIYERISYYFAYFLMLGFPIIFNDMQNKDRLILRFCFIVCTIALFAYRISKGAFASFSLFFM